MERNTCQGKPQRVRCLQAKTQSRFTQPHSVNVNKRITNRTYALTHEKITSLYDKLPESSDSKAGFPPYLSEGARRDDEVHPLHAETPTQRDGLNVALSRSGKRGEQEAHGEGVVDVTDGIDERRVPDRQTGRWVSRKGQSRGFMPLSWNAA